MSRKQYGKVIFILALAFLINNIVFAQIPDYARIFGKDWYKAEAFIAENENWMRPLAEKYRVRYRIAAAIVFPEFVRYSALRDKIEITLLKALYINLGEDYADFSIGPFQMKPSFAEAINEQAPSLEEKIRNQFRKKSDFGDIREYRASIVKDLENPRSEFYYLIAFIKICDAKFGLENADELYRLKILATAYNCGFTKNLDQIKAMTDRKFFNTKLYKTDSYPYSEVSIYWFRSQGRQ